jgi:hypothetical protein
MPEQLKEYRFKADYCLPFQTSKVEFMSFMTSPSGKIVPYLVKAEEEATFYTTEEEVREILAEIVLHPTVFKVQGAMSVGIEVEWRVLNTTGYFAHLTLNIENSEQLGCMIPLG